MVHFVPPSQRRAAVLAAQSDSPALVVGGSGSGKGAIAQWIRKSGPRAGAPVVTASHGENLASRLREAHEGTLLIHEISEWPLSEQRILLNYLKTRTIPHSDGGRSTPVLVNVRVIAMTSHNLDSRVQGGLFNKELLEAFGDSRIEMPDLSDRMDEFREIVTGLLSELTHDLRKDHLRTLSDPAWDRLTSYDWPGNLRELRNVLRYAISHAQGDRIEATDLPDLSEERIDFRATREQFERIYLQELLKTYDSDIDKACLATRIDKSSLLAKFEKFGIRMDGLSKT